MNIYLLLAILSCLPMVFVLVFMLVPASWRWAGTGLSLTGLGTIVSFEQEALGPAIFALAMSLVVIGTRHFEAVIGDIEVFSPE
jgi:hypothetical protein